jgi:hypothetical protein
VQCEQFQNRFQRQEDLVPRQPLAEIKATVIGVGGAPDVSGQAQ